MKTSQKYFRAPARLVASVLALAFVAVAGVSALGHGGSPLAANALQAQTQVALAAPAGSVAAVAQSVGPAVVSVRTNLGLGSGVIYDSNGYVLTNEHVVDQAQSITIGLVDG